MRNFLDWRVDMSGGRRGYLNYPILFGMTQAPSRRHYYSLCGVWTVQEQSQYAPFSLCSSLRMWLAASHSAWCPRKDRLKTNNPISPKLFCQDVQGTKLRHYSNSEGLSPPPQKLKETGCLVWFLTHLHVVQLLCKVPMRLCTVPKSSKRNRKHLGSINAIFGVWMTGQW